MQQIGARQTARRSPINDAVFPEITYQDVIEPEEVLTGCRPSSPTGSQRRDGSTNGHKMRPEKKEKLFRAQYKIVSYFSLRALLSLIIFPDNKDIGAFGLAAQLRNVIFVLVVVLERPLEGHFIAGE